ncbi:envelope stress sensor histidine kinase CpxA [Haemophilus haemoglobinophilus]|nr:envelope stress sensor histidine kinase CpxA [Canicola haemoglobinophilus]MBN6711839.1 envelope stress sensor histidine kinase CpxA [Canicola haemoglobinophilus]
MLLRKPIIFNTLSFRIFAFFWLSLSSLLAISLSLPFLDSQIYSDLTQSELHTYHGEIANSVRRNKLTHIVNNNVVVTFDKFDEVRPVLIDKKGTIWGAMQEEKPYIRKFSIQSGNVSLPRKKTFYDTKIVGPFTVYIDTQEDPYELFFISKVNPQLEIVTKIFNSPWMLISMIMLISTPLLWWLAQSIGRPLKNLQKSANAVALGNFQINTELEKESTIELRQVGQSFNRMTLALNELLTHQQKLLSSISHELRTPLTRLQLSLALLRRKFGETSEINRIQKETLLLEKMINDLLLLARHQLNSHLERDIFPIKFLWKDILEDAKFEAEQKNINLSINIQNKIEQLYINGNKGLLTSAIENIIRNALKYTKSTIEVTINIKDNFLFVALDDDGEGLPETEYEKIFRPFYRVDEARTRETGGTGLGLAIVHNVVHEHQGAVWAGKSHLGGLKVTIKLPLWINK